MGSESIPPGELIPCQREKVRGTVFRICSPLKKNSANNDHSEISGDLITTEVCFANIFCFVSLDIYFAILHIQNFTSIVSQKKRNFDI